MGFGVDALGDHVGNGAGAVGSREQQFVELPGGDHIESGLLLEQRPRLLDHQLRTRYRGQRLLGGGARRRVFGRDIGGGGPRGLVGDRAQRLHDPGHGFEENARFALLGRGLLCGLGLQSKGGERCGGKHRDGNGDGRAAWHGAKLARTGLYERGRGW